MLMMKRALMHRAVGFVNFRRLINRDVFPNLSIFIFSLSFLGF